MENKTPIPFYGTLLSETDDSITYYQDISMETIDLQNKDEFEFILPISIFPNLMGINLCSVKGMEVEEQKDGQIKSIRIDFIPGE